MKISNSKKQLARIINENGGWRDGARFAAQGGSHGHVGFASVAPVRKGKVWDMTRGFAGKFLADELLPNWHQTVLSREEYFHLYPAPVEVVVENKTACHLTVTDKPTIEQLAAEYRNAKDYADRKQQEADAAKADAEAKLAELVAAGKAIGLVLSVAATGPVVAESGDLLEGDVIELTAGERYFKTECTMVHIPSVGLRAKSADDADGQWWDLDGYQESKWRLIRRPAKGDANA